MKRVPSRSLRLLLLGVSVALGMTWVGMARADVSSFMTVGSGVAQGPDLGLSEDFGPVLRLQTGMGTDPSHALTVGGLLRTDTLFGDGTDLSLLVRTTDHGFANGQWGWAFDLGGVARFWGPNAYGLTGTLTLGAPWGLELALGYERGSEDLQTATAIVAIDLARLTVYRRSGDSWWKNTFPAYRPESKERGRQP